MACALNTLKPGQEIHRNQFILFTLANKGRTLLLTAKVSQRSYWLLTSPKVLTMTSIKQISVLKWKKKEINLHTIIRLWLDSLDSQILSEKADWWVFLRVLNPQLFTVFFWQHVGLLIWGIWILGIMRKRQGRMNRTETPLFLLRCF